MKRLSIILFSVFFLIIGISAKPDLPETLSSRFAVPDGFVRTNESKSSFGFFLRNLPLKPKGSAVLYYDKKQKPNNNVYDAVVDLPIGNKDLHQCADAVMRLRADYLYNQKAYDKIHFNFTNGFRVDYSRWRNGERIVINGNKASWVKTAKPSDSYESYWKYMETIFQYAGTASLSKELKPVRSITELQIGDVFIKGGFPGHAVIVVDVAINPSNNKKIYLLAQSYMPAQEIQILKNPMNKRLSPWYEVNNSMAVQTPEWEFKASDLKRF